MASIAGMVVTQESHHPAILEMVKVARELVKEEDEELARETVPTFEENLIKLQKIVHTNPGANAIKDMRAKMCGANPGQHSSACEDFMKTYCAENADSDACANFYGEPKKEKTTPAPAPEKKQPKKAKKAEQWPPKPSQQNVPGLPSQGFDGDDVAHVDGETATDDWRREFGPGQADTYDSVCAKHPNNEWCRLNGYGGLYHGSSERVSTLVGTVTLLAAGLLFA